MSLFGKSAKELVNDAIILEKQGKYNEAVQLLRKAINDDQKYAYAYNLIAWIYAVNDYELEQALGYANKAISFADSTQHKANYIDTRAEIFIRLQRIDEAIDDLRKCINLYGGVDKQDVDHSASYRLAYCYFVKQDITTAFTWISEALKRNPKNPTIHLINGDICLSLEQYIAAINSYKKALDNASEWNFNYLVYGTTTDDEQVKIFKSNCLINMGSAFYYTEDYESCWNCNKQSYELFKQPTSIINLASLAAKRKDKIHVRTLLEEGISLIDTQIHYSSINALLTDPDLEEYRDIVLDLLRNHEKITQLTYVQHKKSSQERRENSDHKNDAHSVVLTGSVKHLVIGTSIGGNMSTFTNKGDNYGLQVGRDFTGGVANFGAVEQSELRNELEKLKSQIEDAKNKGVINEDIAEVASQHVTKAMVEANKPSPVSTTLVEHLNKAKNFLEHAVPLVEGVAKVINIVKAFSS